MVTTALGVLAIYKHKANIKRLMTGTENRLGREKSAHGGREMKITVLGAGAWGTALAQLLGDGKNDVTLWGHNANHLGDLQKTGRNDRYLPGIELSRDLEI